MACTTVATMASVASGSKSAFSGKRVSSVVRPKVSTGRQDGCRGLRPEELGWGLPSWAGAPPEPLWRSLCSHVQAVRSSVVTAAARPLW